MYKRAITFKNHVVACMKAVFVKGNFKHQEKPQAPENASMQIHFNYFPGATSNSSRIASENLDQARQKCFELQQDMIVIQRRDAVTSCLNEDS